ncbi:hypothetical protein D3C73_521780 [compost metagenome]
MDTGHRFAQLLLVLHQLRDGRRRFIQIADELLHLLTDPFKYTGRFPHGGNLLPKERSRIAHHLDCIFNPAANLFSNLRYHSNRLVGLVSQPSDLIGDHNKTSSGRPGSNSFYGSIKRQDIRLLVHGNHRGQDAADQMCALAQPHGVLLNQLHHLHG